jgi:hypothetical protein
MLTFGSVSDAYLRIGKGGLPVTPQRRLQALDSQLAEVRKRSKAYQDKLTLERAVKGAPEGKQNQYQPGDFVLFDKGAKVHPKMSHRFFGPYEVKHQQKNDLDVQNLVTHQHVTVSVEDVKLYAGSRERAYKMAMRDQDQHVVDTIISFTGNSELKSSMMFTIRYQDGDIREMAWTPDLDDSVAYEAFAKRHAYLHHLQWTSSLAAKWMANMRKQEITTCQPGDTIYINIRVFGDDWYDELLLPNSALNTYVAEFSCTNWYHRKSRRVISIASRTAKTTYRLNNLHVFRYVHLTYNPATMVLIDDDFVLKYPQVLQQPI